LRYAGAGLDPYRETVSFAAFQRWWATVPSWAKEASLVLVVAIATVYRISAGSLQSTDRPADRWAYVIGLVMAVALLGRRRWPAVVLAGLTVLWLSYHMLDYPGGAPAVPAWVGLYAGAAAPRRGAAMAVAATLIGSDIQGRTATQQLDLFDPTLDGSLAVFVAALLLGEAARSRRAWQAETRARLALLAVERDRAAAQRRAEDRVRIAQELHDITAHTIAVIGVQAGVAADVLDDSPGQARAALDEVRRASREAMADLRAAVGVLRDGTRADPTMLNQPAPGLERLPSMAQACGAGNGPTVSITCRGTRRPLPRAVETTAYRIAQESLTNVLQHGGASRVEVTLDYRSDGLGLDILDDGRRPPVPIGALDRADEPAAVRPAPVRPAAVGPAAADGDRGYGIRGMVERAGSLGGWLTAGPEPGGGFRVRAWLPARELAS
jgi:signal transduction histidine kinase